MIDINLNDIKPAQRDVARLIGVTPRRLRQLQASGDVPPTGSTLGEQIGGYCEYMRQAEKRARSRTWWR